MNIRVLNPGVLTTVQDGGRFHFRRFGVSTCGAADTFALRVVNSLVGNDPLGAGLEMTLVGPNLHFESDVLVAWNGADFEPVLNNAPLPKDRPVLVPANSSVDFGAARRGMTGWLAVGGEFDLPQFLGSRSTDSLAKFGGVHGRKLAAGDLLPVGSPTRCTAALFEHLGRPGNAASWSLSPERICPPLERGVLSAMRGPEWDWFAPEAQASFFTEPFRVTTESNRMGLRLAGPTLRTSREMISAAVHPGVVQVPSSGQPILLGADCQTIGGYPRIAVVATQDLGSMAQLRPNDSVRFREVSIETAQSRLLQRERDFVLASRELARRAVPSP